MVGQGVCPVEILREFALASGVNNECHAAYSVMPMSFVLHVRMNRWKLGKFFPVEPFYR